MEWMLENMKFISRVEQDISLILSARTLRPRPQRMRFQINTVFKKCLFSPVHTTTQRFRKSPFSPKTETFENAE